MAHSYVWYGKFFVFLVQTPKFCFGKNERFGGILLVFLAHIFMTSYFEVRDL